MTISQIPVDGSFTWPGSKAIRTVTRHDDKKNHTYYTVDGSSEYVASSSIQVTAVKAANKSAKKAKA